jgi:formylglycine-generating enzyme
VPLAAPPRRFTRQTRIALACAATSVAMVACQSPPQPPPRPTNAAATAGRPSDQPAAPRADQRTEALRAIPGMTWIPAGTFWMGCEDCGMPDALPVHQVSVDGFWMDITPVTNDQFAAFVQATHYITVAERKPDPKDVPGVPAQFLQPGSLVFTPPSHPVSLEDYSQWWSYVPGANWRHPTGPASDLTGLGQHPVVHIAWEDAQAYAKWAGKRLPTEAEFEFAARGGLDRNRYAWGNQLTVNGKTPANIWQGHFPDSNTAEDGYARTSPVTGFPPNGYGLYDVGGNVWEWCADWYRPDYYRTFTTPNVPARDPRGPDASFDPDEPGAQKRVTRGGSFLCSGEYCARYLVGSRGKAEIKSGSSNLGFRLVRSGQASAR